MENNFKADVSATDILAQNEHEHEEKHQAVPYDVKNYLQATLAPNQNEKKITIRLLPFSSEGGTPFKKVYMHLVRVNKEIAPSGWKTFVCPKHNGHNGKCPYCETSEEANALKNKETDPTKKEAFNKVAFANMAKEMWIVRCIEREHENDGPKFWLFAHSRKHDGVYDKMINLFKNRAENAAKKGKELNIFSVEEGRDLIITISRTNDDKRTIAVDVDDDNTPLSSDIEKANSWITDGKQWTDVFKEKPYEFMSIILSGKIPFFDKEKQCYVEKIDAKEYKDKKEQEKKSEEIVTNPKFTENSDKPNAEETVEQDSVDFNENDDTLPF